MVVSTAAAASFVTVWLATVVWTARDAARRCRHAAFAFGWTAIAFLVPIVGAVIYVLARPLESRADVRMRRLRTRILQASLAEAADRCAACATPLRPEFRCCPGCGARLREQCAGCAQLVQPTWTACPWCARRLVHEPRVLPEVA